ncbi:MAG: preprotein translocase subunit YajC [Alphaproteobacteria bacterium]|nr:preprotein translocase subunit YajC [Alphaproteobacteria bacterium]MDD9920167.1 preprotein translocase subunit YajC [Alphaproteobacteria bacterium]
MFISTAYAEVAAPAAASGIMSFLPLVFVLVVFYFLVMRPQSQRAKEHTSLLETLRRGDKVLTTGGFHAAVTKVNDDGTLTIELAEGLTTTLEKAAVVRVLVKASDTKTEKKKAKAGKKPLKTKD